MDTIDRSRERVGKVHIIQPVDSDGNALELYFTVTEGGYLLHIENMGKIKSELVYEELEKLLLGMEHSKGRYNEFIKNPDKYRVMHTVTPNLTVEDAATMDSAYKMTPEQRRDLIRKNPEAWFRGADL